MNPTAAFVCFPIFFLVFLLDAYFCFYAYKRDIAQWQKMICLGCVATSFLQWFSLIFWVVGFVKSPTGATPDSCRNLVAAEIIIFIFQWTFTLTTFYLFLVLINVYQNLKIYTKFPPWMYAVFVFVTLLTLSWIPVQSFTPWNDWCAGDEKIMTNIYQPANMVWCVLDVGTSLGIVAMFLLLYRRLLNSMETMTHLKNLSGDENKDNHAHSSRVAAKQTKTLARHVMFALQQAIVSIVSMSLSGLVFDAQYNYGITSDLVCMFCVMLYCSYAIRRVPMSWHFSSFRSRRDAISKTDTAPPSITVFSDKRSEPNSAIRDMPRSKVGTEGMEMQPRPSNVQPEPIDAQAQPKQARPGPSGEPARPGPSDEQARPEPAPSSEQPTPSSEQPTPSGEQPTPSNQGLAMTS